MHSWADIAHDQERESVSPAVHAAPQHDRMMDHHPKIFMYHRVVEHEPQVNDHWTCVHVDHFRRQLQVLDDLGFTTITLQDYSLFRMGQLNLPKKPVVLTFDDGYLDTYQVAFPQLLEFGMKGVVFALANPNLTSNTWDVSNHIPGAPLMEREHVLAMHDAGFEIGSHGMNHRNLASIPEHEACEEIVCSKAALERLLDAPVDSFAYPYGRLTGRIKQMVADAGYALACGVFTGPSVCGTDIYDIRRITVTGEMRTSSFRMRLLFPYERLQWIQRKAGETFTSLVAKENSHNRTREER